MKWFVFILEAERANQSAEFESQTNAQFTGNISVWKSKVLISSMKRKMCVQARAEL